MDEIVARAMAKWPDVPAVYGWLALDSRGQWLIKGERIGNPFIVEFIGRNYDHDEQGRWFFQNGPQRVFVDLAYTPYVYHCEPFRLLTQNGRSASRVSGCWMDELGRVLVLTELGVGTIHDRQVEAFSWHFTDASGLKPSEDWVLDEIDKLQCGSSSGLRLEWRGERIPVEPIRALEVPQRFSIDPSPQPAASEEACT